MTNTKRKNPLEEARNPVQNRIRYQRRKQQEQEAKEQLKEALQRHGNNDPLSQIP